MIVARQGELGAAGGDPSILEAFLGEKPGFLRDSLSLLKTMLIISTVVTVGVGIVVLADRR